MDGKPRLWNAGTEMVLALYSMTSEAAEILNEGMDTPYPYDDKNPDGPSWYIPVDDLSSESIYEICTQQLGYITGARVLAGYTGSEDQKTYLHEHFPFNWCGYPSRCIVYIRDAE